MDISNHANMQQQSCYKNANGIFANISVMDGLHSDRELIEALVAFDRSNPTTIARKAGLAVTTVTRIANGKATTRLSQPTFDKLKVAFPAFPWASQPVPTSEEIPGLRPVESVDVDDDGVVRITKLDLAAAMGDGVIVGDFVGEEQVAFDAAFIRSLTRTPARFLRMITGIGDSMHPTLVDGDILIVDTSVRSLARQDGIYWIRLFEAHAIKRLRAIAAGRVMVKSDNPVIEDQEVDAEDLKIEGRAIWVSRGL